MRAILFLLASQGVALTSCSLISGVWTTNPKSIVSPYGVALASDGTLYVAECQSNEIHRLRGDTWITIGDSSDGFQCPRAVAVDSDDNVYATSTTDTKIYKLSGSTWSALPTDGTAGPATDIKGIAVDREGTLYVADQGTEELHYLEKGGGSLDWRKWSSVFYSPYAVAVSKDGDLFVTDCGDGRSGTSYIGRNKRNSGSYFERIGKESDGFTCSHGVAVDAGGVVYATDTVDHRVRKYADSDSNYTWIIVGGDGNAGSSNTGLGQFNAPEGVAVNTVTGSVYVADKGNDRIREFLGRPFPQSPVFCKRWLPIGEYSRAVNAFTIARCIRSSADWSTCGASDINIRVLLQHPHPVSEFVVAVPPS